MEDAVASGARPWRTQWRLVNYVEGGSLLGRDVDSSKVSFSKTYMFVIRSHVPPAPIIDLASRPPPPPLILALLLLLLFALSLPPSRCQPKLLLLFDLMI